MLSGGSADAAWTTPTFLPSLLSWGGGRNSYNVNIKDKHLLILSLMHLQQLTFPWHFRSKTNQTKWSVHVMLNCGKETSLINVKWWLVLVGVENKQWTLRNISDEACLILYVFSINWWYKSRVAFKCWESYKTMHLIDEPWHKSVILWSLQLIWFQSDPFTIDDVSVGLIKDLTLTLFNRAMLIMGCQEQLVRNQFLAIEQQH